VAQEKVKKDVAELSIPLERNPDILAELGQNKGQRVLVGFAAETQDLMANAAQKVRTKHLDFIVANDISDPSIGFASDDNRVHILDAAGQIEELPTMARPCSHSALEVEHESCRTHGGRCRSAGLRAVFTTPRGH
jgi:phosphopantothenoylcysteine decarboxylase/phosphopantothenate--cysteine ligase